MGPALDHVKKGYYKNKKTAKEHCKRVLIQKKEDQKWIDFYMGSKRKLDDLADCYLQGLAYKKFVMSKGDNPERYPKKKNKKTCKGLTKKKEQCNSAVSKKNSYCKKHIKQKLKVKKPVKKKEKKVSKELKIPKKLCKGTTKKGLSCKYKASVGSFCKTHSV